MTSSKLVTKPGTSDPKAVVSFYEDFLCPACGNFERTFGPTVSKLIDIGAIAADYSMVSILDSPQNQNYSSRAGAASLCVADESIDAYRRFHTALYSKGIQPDERGPSFPDNAKLIELAREAGVVGKVPDCINSGKYLAKVNGAAAAGKYQRDPDDQDQRQRLRADDAGRLWSPSQADRGRRAGHRSPQRLPRRQ